MTEEEARAELVRRSAMCALTGEEFEPCSSLVLIRRACERYNDAWHVAVSPANAHWWWLLQREDPPSMRWTCGSVRLSLHVGFVTGRDTAISAIVGALLIHEACPSAVDTVKALRALELAASRLRELA